MTRITKYLAAAAVGVGVLLAAGPATAQQPTPGFTPKIYPPPTVPGWPYPPRPPFPRPPYPYPPHVDYDYAVYIRVGGFVGWRQYGTYETRYQAERVGRWLEYRGYQTRVARVPDRPHILGQ